MCDASGDVTETVDAVLPPVLGVLGEMPATRRMYGPCERASAHSLAIRASSPASTVRSACCPSRRTCGFFEMRALCTAAPILRKALRRCNSTSAISSGSCPGWPWSSTRREAPMSSDANRPSSRRSKPNSAKTSSCMVASARICSAATSGVGVSQNWPHTPASDAARPWTTRKPLQLPRHLVARDRLVARHHAPQQRWPLPLRHAGEEVQLRVDRVHRERVPSELHEQRRAAPPLPVRARWRHRVRVKRPIQCRAAELRRLAGDGDLEQVDLQVRPTLSIPRQQAVLDRAVPAPLQLGAEVLAVRRRHDAPREALGSSFSVLAGAAPHARSPGSGNRSRTGCAHTLGRCPQIGNAARRGLVQYLVRREPRGIGRQYFLQPAQPFERGAHACRHV
eukprot:6212905-Pleurochrysis_carterae.AAC.3